MGAKQVALPCQVWESCMHKCNQAILHASLLQGAFLARLQLSQKQQDDCDCNFGVIWLRCCSRAC